MGQAIPENDVTGKVAIGEGNDLYYIKLVGIGPNALAEKNGSVVDVVDGVQGYYFVAPTNEIEEQLISIIRGCFADRRKQQEKEHGTAQNG